MEPIVETKAGKLTGAAEEGLFIFRGVRYAAPPVGPRRWLPPQPVPRWTGVVPARQFGPAAPQPTSHPIELVRQLVHVPQPQNEDCLFLNVWTPGLDDAKRPVLVWIHGGGWQHGAGSQPNYDGATLARNGDVVVVTINFRLGALGFLNLNEVTGGRIPSTGNEGSLDQVAALAWVQDNIASFGGDPANVTILGQSSGSVHCAFLLASPLARGLFRRAVLQSSAAHTAHTVESAARVARLLLECLELNPKDVDAIRAVGCDRLVDTTYPLINAMLADDPTLGIMHYHPVIDGTALTAMPIEAIRSGASKDVSLLAGTNLDEQRISLAADEPAIAAARPIPQVMDEGQLREMVVLVPDDWRQDLLDTYRASLQKRGQAAGDADVLLALASDRVLRLPTIRLLEAKRSHDVPGHGYLFTWESPALGGVLRACHALEMGFLFGTYDDTFCGSGPDADRLSRTIQDAWVSFARTGDPSCGSVGHWPSYGEKRETMILAATPHLVDAPYEDERLAWEGIPESALGLM